MKCKNFQARLADAPARRQRVRLGASFEAELLRTRQFRAEQQEAKLRIEAMQNCQYRLYEHQRSLLNSGGAGLMNAGMRTTPGMAAVVTPWHEHMMAGEERMLRDAPPRHPLRHHAFAARAYALDLMTRVEQACAQDRSARLARLRGNLGICTVALLAATVAGTLTYKLLELLP